MTLADHVRTLGRGPSRARNLTQDEARDAMTLMLSPDAAPEAVGALLMLMRMRGETAEEIAGFAQAAKAGQPSLPSAALDWPSYAAGRTRGLPLFLLSARLVALAGHRVVLHGWNGPNGLIRRSLQAAGIAEAQNPQEAERALDRDGLVYMPLESLSPGLQHLIGLRAVLGLRSCVNTVCRMTNPFDAQASVQGVFHPSYRMLQADAAQILGLRDLSVIKGGGGEFERHPTKQISVFGLRRGVAHDTTLPAVLPEATRRLDDGNRDPGHLHALWSGAETDAFATAVILGTAALALSTLGHDRAHDLARDLWVNRQGACAA